jgi:pimeloyl-ACP methyl ester carboxylesterase
MFSPGGFDATVEKWSTLGVYARVKLLEHLPKKYMCIAFDRRETGQSSGRIERVTWQDFAAQGKGLLQHLGIERAHLIGGCMGCSVAIAFAAAHPQSTMSMVLWWPVGGAKYRIKGQQRFFDHLAFVDEAGLQGVVDLVAREGKAFNAGPRGGPWSSVIKRDPEFARAYLRQDVDQYKAIVTDMAIALLDRDTAPGADRRTRCASTSRRSSSRAATNPMRHRRRVTLKRPAACRIWDMPTAEQTEANAPPRILQFLEGPLR